MGRFYEMEAGSPQQRLWLYSERGVLSYLYHHVLLHDLAFILDEAQDSTGRPLRTVVGAHSTHRVLTEFELGGQGFGSPDGGVWIKRENANPVFLFVEGKATQYDASYKDPKSYEAQAALVADPNTNLDALCRANTFNSSINGQLELRWRFKNALLVADLGRQLVTEQRVTLDQAILAGDRFYWRQGLQPQKGVAEQWRRVHLAGDLQCLHQLLHPVKEWHLLAITDDASFPKKLIDTRLFDEFGAPLSDATQHLWWMPFRAIANQLRSL